MSRPAKVCTEPGCPNVQPCPSHRREPWAHSNRRAGVTLSGSAQQKRTHRILRRDGGICHVCHQPGADQADHVVPIGEGGADDEANLAAIHSRPCHQRKTADEAARARAGRIK